MKYKKALVTGADGFIGSHLAEALLDKGYAVKAFVYYNSFNSWGWLDTLPKSKLKHIEVFAGDIRDPNGVRAAMKGADAVFHLAALIGIPFSYHSPDSYVDTNVKGTLNVLQAARDLGTGKVVVTSTSEVYGTARYAPIDEKHPLQGQSPYSASKIGADKIAESFHLSFGLPVVTARPFNTYGPRQSARAIIPTIITQLLNGAKEIKLGSLAPTRDLSYVADTCAGFLALAAAPEAVGKTVNIGSGREISVGDLAALIMKLSGRKAALRTEAARRRPAGSEVERLLCDNELIASLTGWKPSVSLEKGLERTIEWFRDPKNSAGYKSDIYNV
ncbi:MAG: SDR family NAD(P)-dependent oxidoreductase [Elusimicrobia bacterium]|nr:SDR family NAD(P)-dependent oxidoreductase [Elusimicrobiota bacterium]